MTPLIREMASLMGDMAETGMWFDLGEIPEMVRVNPAGVLATTPLPYPTVFIVGYRRQGGKMILVATQTGDVIALMGDILFPDRYKKLPELLLAQHEGEIKRIEQESESDDDDEARGYMAGVLEYFQARVNPEGYRATAKRSLINAKRAKKGKPPLQYDWHTVTIKPPQMKSEPKGGTHASPRQHDRRGHWRNHPSGKRVWVKACTVGDPAKGLVSKDYRA